VLERGIIDPLGGRYIIKAVEAAAAARCGVGCGAATGNARRPGGIIDYQPVRACGLQCTSSRPLRVNWYALPWDVCLAWWTTWSSPSRRGSAPTLPLIPLPRPRKPVENTISGCRANRSSCVRRRRDLLIRVAACVTRRVRLAAWSAAQPISVGAACACLWRGW
jgi:hypothetical protein